jgi:phage tail sheath protein FI
MPAFKHGVYQSELSTALVAPRQVDTAIPFVVGTAPIHLSSTGLDDLSKQVNYPILAMNQEEAVTKLGYSDDWDKYTLCEFMYSEFQVYNTAPVVFVNVLDPEYHKTAVAEAAYPVSDKQAVLGKDVILDSVVVSLESSGTALVLGTDYTLAWDRNANAVLNVLTGNPTQLFISFDVLDPGKVTAADIVGGYNAISGRNEGLELINTVFMRYGKVPALICAPGWSENPEVAAVMVGKTQGISGLFPCFALTDIPSGDDGVEDYTEVSEWKRLNSYTDTRQLALWPMGMLGGKRFHLSTLAAGIIALTDAEFSNIPYASPSNHSSKMTGAVTKSGKELLLDLNQVNLLNENGICTLFNWESGWMLWGNETGCFPSNTDPKDRFINVRRFYNWWAVTFILTWFQKVDRPLNRRLLETIEDTENIRINAYVALGALVGPNNKIEFRAEDNPLTDLIDGVIRAHTRLTVPPPARVIENIAEYDPENLLSLFL